MLNISLSSYWFFSFHLSLVASFIIMTSLIFFYYLKCSSFLHYIRVKWMRSHSEGRERKTETLMTAIDDDFFYYLETPKSLTKEFWNVHWTSFPSSSTCKWFLLSCVFKWVLSLAPWNKKMWKLIFLNA